VGDTSTSSVTDPAQLEALQQQLLEEQIAVDADNDRFQSKQENETNKAKVQQTTHDAKLAIIEGLKGQ
jgi:hypothetical protein